MANDEKENGETVADKAGGADKAGSLVTLTVMRCLLVWTRSPLAATTYAFPLYGVLCLCAQAKATSALAEH